MDILALLPDDTLSASLGHLTSDVSKGDAIGMAHNETVLLYGVTLAVQVEVHLDGLCGIESVLRIEGNIVHILVGENCHFTFVLMYYADSALCGLCDGLISDSVTAIRRKAFRP
tara:strand:+ start:13864 stop:14205 length:342 start_codon:yes stop_codon:yes gene_type:complete